jgi:hypothetical protein
MEHETPLNHVALRHEIGTLLLFYACLLLYTPLDNQFVFIAIYTWLSVQTQILGLENYQFVPQG